MHPEKIDTNIMSHNSSQTHDMLKANQYNARTDRRSGGDREPRF